MRRGEVVYCPQYKFSDGSEDDKLLINLNDPAPGEPYLIILTTSQPYTRVKKEGCHSNLGYYVILKGKDFFDKEMTWILFSTIKEYTFKEELRESFKGNFETKGFLKNETVNAIINCLKCSNYITIYQASLLKTKPALLLTSKPLILQQP